MKKYIVVCCYERDIEKNGQADTLEEAQQIMKDDFVEYCSNYDDYDPEKTETDKYELNETSAWSNLGDDKCDWAIIAVE